MTTIAYTRSFAQGNAPRPDPLTGPASGGILSGAITPGAEDTAARRRYNRSNPRQMGSCGVPRNSEKCCRADQCGHRGVFVVDAALRGEAMGEVCLPVVSQGNSLGFEADDPFPRETPEVVRAAVV